MDTLPKNDLGYFLTNIYGDKYLYEVNHNIFNKLGSKTVYESKFGANFFTANSLFIIVGTDSGLFANYINKLGVPNGSRFLFIELPEIIDRLHEALTIENLDPLIDVITFTDLETRLSVINFNDYVYLNKVFLLEAFCAQDAYLVEYRQLYSNIRQQIEATSWLIKSSLGSKSFLLRQLENLPDNQVSGTCLKNIFKDKTAVLLGGGPSLDDTIPWVKKNRANLVVLAVSRISRRLLEVDLTPDIIFSVDPLLVSFDVSREMLSFWEKTLFVHAFHVCPSLLGQWQGRSVFLGPRLPWQVGADEDESLCIGPTVTNTAMEVAIYMGFSKIILGGVDLCNNREGYSHAKGSHEHKTGPKIAYTTINVETNTGRIAESTSPYKLGVATIGVQAEKAAKQGCKVINAAADAAKIPYVEYLSLENLANPKLDEPAQQTILKSLPEQNRGSFIKHYQKIRQELQYATKKLNEIKKLSIEALAANDGLFGRRGKKADFKYKKQMDKIEKTLNHKYKNFTQVIKKLGAEHFLKMIRPDQKEWTDEEIENTGRIYYETYRESAKLLLELIKKSDDRLKARQEEEKDNPDFKMLFKQWHMDKQPGRARIWQARHPEQLQKLTSKTLAALTKMNSELEYLLHDDQGFTGNLTGNPFNPLEARTQATVFMKQQDKEELQKLLQRMSKNSHQDIKPLSHLVQGYLAELNGETTQAFKHYEKLFPYQDSPFLEDALKRIASLSLTLNDYNNALIALECLAGISPTYMPNFADLLWLTGKNQQALDIYADYFNKIPEDLASMLKLGNYYKELNMEAGVRMVADYVLEKNPGNQAAKYLLQGLKNET